MAKCKGQETRPFKSWRGVLSIIGGVLVHVTLGTLYSYGNMAPYIVSYGRVRGHTPDLTYETSSFIFSAMKLGHGLSMWAGGWLERRVGVRLATLMGVAIFSLSMFLSAWAITVSFYFLLFTYGFLFGIGLGIAYLPPLVCAMKWMPDSKGVISGCLVAGFGAGSLIFNFVQTGLVNPGNLQPDASIESRGAEQLYYTQDVILDRVPFSFIVQGIIFVVMQLVGIAFLSDPPEKFKRTRGYAVRRKRKEVTEKSRILMKDTEISNEGNEDNYSTSDNVDDRPSTSSTTRFEDNSASYDDQKMLMTSGSELEDEDRERHQDHLSNERAPPQSLGDHDRRWSGRTVSPVGMFKEVVFWKIIAIFAAHTFAVVSIVTLYKAFGQTVISDDLFLTVSGAFASLFNAGGRIFWGYIADRFSFKVSFAGLCTVMAFFLFTFSLCIYGKEPLYFIWVCLLFSSIGGAYAIMPTATSRIFGSESVGVNYGIIFLLGSSIPGVITSAIQYVMFAHLAWPYVFVVVGVFPALGLLGSMFINVKTPDGDDV